MDDNATTTAGVFQTYARSGSDSPTEVVIVRDLDVLQYCFACERETPHRMPDTTGGRSTCGLCRGVKRIVSI